MARLTQEEILIIQDLYTLPELLESLDVDFSDLEESTLNDLYYDMGDEIRDLLDRG